MKNPLLFFKVVFLWGIHLLFSFLKFKKMAFIDEYATLILETVEVPGESNIEAVSKTLLTQFIGSAVSAQKIQALADAGDAEILDVSRSLVRLAQQFNRAFKNLTAEQKAEISAVVEGIVTGANQTDVESFFNGILEIVGTAQQFSAELTVLLETEPPVEPPANRR